MTKIENMKKVILTKEGKYYIARGIDIDVSSFGNTKKEALCNLKEARDLFNESKKNERD